MAAALFAVGAAESYSLGLGAQFGGGLSGSNVALLISPKKDIHFAGSWWLDKDYAAIGITADYWVLEPRLTSVGSGALNFFVGPGLFVNIGFSKPANFDAGFRVPLGLDLKFTKFDMFLQIAPLLCVQLLPGFGLSTGNWFAAALGARFWI